MPSLGQIREAFLARALDRDATVLLAGGDAGVPLSKCLGLRDLMLATIGSTVGESPAVSCAASTC